MTDEEFKEKIKEKFRDIIVLGKFEKMHKKILFKHNNPKCGFYEWVTLPNNVMHNGSGCPKCAGTIKKTTEMFKEEVFNLVGDEYTVVGEYINSQTKIEISHSVCNKSYEVLPYSFESMGNRCPRCKESKGEEKVSSMLENKKIVYKQQYRFDDCRNKKPLPFDFAIFNEDKTLNCLIEYDGEQHYKPVDYWGGEEAFKQRQHNDQIKTQYCKDNNIKLIRIPYWDFDNIEDILNEGLKEVINQSKSESNV